MKKKILDGQPLYMAQYTSLMIILLAFFILLQTMSTVNEGGFKEGIGNVKNAFGLTGGMGIFEFIIPFRGGAKTPNPISSGNQDKQGLHDNLVKGEGGYGNTDARFHDRRQGRYLEVKIPVKFNKFATHLTADDHAVLDKFKVGFILYDYRIIVKCFARDFRDRDKDDYLALQRAANIMRYIHQSAMVPYSRLEAQGNSSLRYYSEADRKKMPEQEAFFCIYENNAGTVN
ncbi:MAG: flagellar motor protein MotB [Victivallales bacterium]|nr:flagellar motor protein MotB [Victivallales bacterium]